MHDGPLKAFGVQSIHLSRYPLKTGFKEFQVWEKIQKPKALTSS